MTASHTDHRRLSTGLHHSSQGDIDEVAPLSLSRTRSQEFDFAESIAVQELALDESNSLSDNEITDISPIASPHLVRYLVFLCAFLTSLSFGVTQVPLVYIFRLMTCDAYYKDHTIQGPHPMAQSSINWLVSFTSDAFTLGPWPPFSFKTNDFDRCSIHAIETSTALSISLLGASTTVFGILNLFLTGALIKRIGLKATLIIQVFFPAVRLLIQNIGVEVWGGAGINIIQFSQVISIFGGPSGYVLVLNTFITEVVAHEGRTAALGRLGGSMMFGAALGFLLGGVMAEEFGIKVPFRLTLILFLSSCAYVAIFLPYIPPAEAKTAEAEANDGRGKRTLLSRFFEPLLVFSPRKFIGRDGVVRTEYGAFLLACGVYLAILATGYLATLLQLYSTDVFGFGTKQNGALIFMYSMLRGLFLTFAFPKLIAVGREFTIQRKHKTRPLERSEGLDSPEREPLLTNQSQASNGAETNANKDKGEKKEQLFTFDLTYTRFSLLADGLLTLLCSFVRDGWQMYLVAAVLPFSAGTGSASKGTILQMIGSSANSAERTDALAGLSLVENMARMSTTFVFGVVFAAFASIGKTEFVFACNAAVALLGFAVLLFAKFPPEGSQRLDKDDGSIPILEDER